MQLPRDFCAAAIRRTEVARSRVGREAIVSQSRRSRVAVITAAQRDNSLVHHRPLERRPVPRGKFPAIFSAVIRRKPTAEGEKMCGLPAGTAGCEKIRGEGDRRRGKDRQSDGLIFGGLTGALCTAGRLKRFKIR